MEGTATQIWDAGPRQANSLGASPRITVAVPSLNEAAYIENTLSQILNQKLRGGILRVVVADGGSSDETRAIVSRMAKRDCRIELRDNPGRFAAAARNIAVCSGDFDVLMVIDAHCHLPDEKVMQRALDALSDSGADCLSRPQPIRGRRGSVAQRAAAVARASVLGHCPGSRVYDTRRHEFVSALSAAQIYRRQVFERVGLFLETLSSCEDLEFNIRVDAAGLSTFHCGRAMVEYYPRDGILGLFRHMQRYGEGRAQVALIHWKTAMSLTGVLPAIFVLYVLLGSMVWLAGPGWGIAHAASICAYLVSLLAVAILCARRQERRVAAIVPLALAAIHVGWGVGQLKAVLTGRAFSARRLITPRAYKFETTTEQEAPRVGEVLEESA